MVDFRSNIPLVHYVVNKYYNKYYQMKPDLIQEGMIGLWKACKTFKEEKGIKFATYATRCIMNNIGMFLRGERKHLDIKSLDETYTIDASGDEVAYVDILEADEPEYFDDRIFTVCKRPDIVKLWMAGYTQTEIGEKVGFSQVHVHRLFEKDLASMRKFLNGERPELKRKYQRKGKEICLER